MNDFFQRLSQWLGSITPADLEPYKGPIAIGFLLLFAAGFGLLFYREKRRRAALAGKAKELGLKFRPDPDHKLAAEAEFLNYLGRGRDRYAFNIIEGIYRGQPVRCFDYHFATGGKDSVSCYFSVYMLYQPKQFPRLEISPKSFVHRIDSALGLGMASVEFESMAFTKAFAVNTEDRRFAYDVCHPRMMDFLMQHQHLTIEFEGNCIAICYMSVMKPKRVKPHLEVLAGIRERIPEYLYAD